MKLRNLSGVALTVLLIGAACQGGGGGASPGRSPAQSPTAQSPTTQSPVTSPETSPTMSPATSPESPGTSPASPGTSPASPGTSPGGGESRVVTLGPDDPIRIAMWGVLTGSDAALGQDVLRGVEIAVDDRGGELLGHEIELINEDAGCNPEGGSTAATRLAADPTLLGLVGSVCSDETVGGIGAITAAGLTTISPSNTRPALTAEDRGPEFAGYLRTAHNDEVQGARAAEFVYDVLGLRSAATIHDGSSYAQALQQVFADEFEALGGTITIQTAVGGEDTDMTPVLTNVAGTNPEIIYYPVFTAPFGFITAQVRSVPGLETVALMGADAGFSAAAIEAAGPNALDMYLSSPDTRQFEAGYEDFLAKHQEKYGEAPLQIFHAHAYDAANMLFTAIEQVAQEQEDGSLNVPLGELRDALFATNGFQGLTGSLSCTPTGDCADPAIGVYQITQDIVDDPSANWPPQAIWPEVTDGGASPGAGSPGAGSPGATGSPGASPTP